MYSYYCTCVHAWCNYNETCISIEHLLYPVRPYPGDTFENIFRCVHAWCNYNETCISIEHLLYPVRPYPGDTFENIFRCPNFNCSNPRCLQAHSEMELLAWNKLKLGKFKYPVHA